MPKAFVHGIPETTAIWGALVDELEIRGVGDIQLLTPPGFGAPVPRGFEPNQSNYCDWLLAELEALGSSVDLAGHDWGAGRARSPPGSDSLMGCRLRGTHSCGL